jgi:hypothetical protein
MCIQDPLTGLSDAMLDEKTLAPTLLLHGLHGVFWSFTTRQINVTGRRFASPTAELWTVTNRLCKAASKVDFAYMVSCAHGLGHALRHAITALERTRPSP